MSDGGSRWAFGFSGFWDSPAGFFVLLAADSHDGRKGVAGGEGCGASKVFLVPLAMFKWAGDEGDGI